MKTVSYTRRQSLLALFCLLALPVLYESCTFFEEERQETFHIQAHSLVDVGVEKWLIVQNDGTHTGSQFSPTLVIDGSETDFCLEMKKNCVCAVLVYPVQGGKTQRPLGALYPYSTDVHKEGGFCAFIIDRLYRGIGKEGLEQVQDFVSRFNWIQFYAVCKEKGADDIWSLDYERIIEKIISGRFSKNDIKIKKEAP